MPHHQPTALTAGQQTSLRDHPLSHGGHHKSHRLRFSVLTDSENSLDRQGLASSLVDQPPLFGLSSLPKPSALLEAEMRTAPPTQVIASLSQGSRPGQVSDSDLVAYPSRDSQRVINYDVEEEPIGKGNDLLQNLLTSTSPGLPSSSSVFPSNRDHHHNRAHPADSSLILDSSDALTSSNWSSNLTSIWDTTALPEPEVYNVPRLSAEIQVALYSIIFSTALVGNLLIIVTLIQNKRMRTVTNVFLLNLAVSDLLLALVCMPFTLVPVLLMDFIFGAFMCVFIRYLQGEYKHPCVFS